MGLSPMRPGAKAERGLRFEDNDRSDGVANPLPAKLNWCGNFRDYQGNAVVVINLVASTKGIYWLTWPMIRCDLRNS